MEPILQPDEFLRRLADRHGTSSILAMYSSWAGGIVTDPSLMLVPVEDHMVHRGDAVFETIKAVHGAVYLLDPHLERLAGSARAVGLDTPWNRAQLRQLILDVLAAAGRQEALVRVLLSRGTGSLGVNPYDCPRPELYIMAAPLPEAVMTRRPQGVSAAASSLHPKTPPMAAIKSCNYLLNALMKKEAVDRDLDFVAGFTAEGFLAEAPTENIAVVTSEGILAAPPPGMILEGTTLTRVFELAEDLPTAALPGRTARRMISREEMRTAREILVIGTTPNVTAVTTWEGRPVGSGLPGPVYTALSSLLERDMREGSGSRTPLICLP